MKDAITIGYLTARREPKFDWFADSISGQMKPGQEVHVIVVDYYCKKLEVMDDTRFSSVLRTPCKPNVWQGDSRLTQADYWAKSAYINTLLCLAKTPWVGLVDDRCVVQPGYFDAIAAAMEVPYIVAGGYQKRHNMTVERGLIINGGTITGTDCRHQGQNYPQRCEGSWLFGCNYAMPLEWALQTGGSPEDYCDSISMEDVIWGMIFQRNNYPVQYDPRMFIVEDRTPDASESWVKRTDKGVSPRDKSHKLLDVFHRATNAKNSFDIRQMRELIQRGEPFPNPTASDKDWYDGQPLREFK